MKKDRLKKKLLVLLLPVVLAGIIAALIYIPKIIWERQAADRLEDVYEALTYQYEARYEEMYRLYNADSSNLDMEAYGRYNQQLLKTISRVEQHIGMDLLQIGQSTLVQGLLATGDSGDKQTEAWIYMEAAQLFLNLNSVIAARECLLSALKAAEQVPMEPYFYELCYTRLAFCETGRNGQVNLIRRYNEIAVSYKTEEKPEYYSLELQRLLTEAICFYQTMHYSACREALVQVKEYMDSFTGHENDVVLLTNFVLPYYKTAVCLAIRSGQAEEFLALLEEGFQRIQSFMEVKFSMEFLTAVSVSMQNGNLMQIEESVMKEAVSYIEKALMKMPTQISQSNSANGEQLLYSARTTCELVTERSKTERLYRTILQIIGWVVLIFASMLTLIGIIRRKSNIDGLTKAYVRRHYDEVYSRLCRREKTFGLIMYDIDFFKKFNDSFGHEFGDEVLRRVSATAMTLAPKRKVKLFRFGGDEFIMICTGMPLDEIVDLAERIRAAVEALDWGVDTKVTLSMGASISLQAEDNLMKLTDENVYRSKEAGRNRVSYQPFTKPEYSFVHKRGSK